MRLSPWTEDLFLKMLRNNFVAVPPPGHYEYNYDTNPLGYKDQVFALDLCEAGIEDAWNVGTMRDTKIVTATPSFVSTTSSQGTICTLASDLTFTPTADFSPASWRLRNGPNTVFAGTLTSSARLKAARPYIMRKQEFQLSMSKGTDDFAQWFFSVFFTKTATDAITLERTYFVLSAFTPTFPNPFVPGDDTAIDISAGGMVWTAKGGTLTNDKPMTFSNSPDWDTGMVKLSMWRMIAGTPYLWMTANLNHPVLAWKGKRVTFERNQLSVVMQ